MSTITQFPSGNTQYRIEFDYLARTFVVVTLVNSSNPTLNRVLEVGRDYRFLNPTMIEMLVDQSGFDIVRIHRQTGTDLVVDFRNGSVLTASDLTNAELQAIHIAEEGRDQTVDLAKEYAASAGSSAGNAKDSEDEARRIAESIRAFGRIGYIPRRSFEKGFNVTTWNEVLLWEEDGEYYRWDGTLPKNVPAGSTPESSGGIGLGAWVSVGDASLRHQLSSKLGSLMVGFSRVDDVPRTIGDKLKDVPTANDYMLPSETNLTLAINRAAADGVKSLFVTSDRSYNISSIVELPDDFELLGYGRPSVVCADIASIIRMNSRTTVSGLKLTGLSPAVISPYNGAVDVCISGNFFNGQNQIVLLLECSDVTVANNVFDGTGYGIIQQVGYASNNVRIINNNARNMKFDFVEANSASIGTRSWQILSNIYDGADNWHSLATEQRFVGITELEDVTISNNLVRRTAGDSAIHLEDLLGRTTISDNFFVDSFAGQGCIYNLSSDDDMLVSGNWFVMTDDYTGVNTTAIRTDSREYTHRCKISSNIFFDATSTGKKLRPVFLAYGGTFDYEDNLCVNTYDIARFASIDTPRFSRNRGVGQLQRGIWSDGNAGSGAIYDGNIIPSLVETGYGIRATTNSQGTGGPKRHAAYNNHIGGDIRIEDPVGNPGQTAENAAWGNRVTGEIVVTNRITADSFGNYSVTAI